MLRFHNIDQPSDSKASDSSTSAIVVALNKNEILELDSSSVILKVLGLNSATAVSFLHSAVGRLTPAKDAPVTIELLVPYEEGGVFKRVVIALLPSYCSRNNTPSFSHAVATVIKGNKGSGNLAVALLTTSPDLAFAQALAVARCFPTFSFTAKARKDAAENKPEDTIDILLHAGIGESSEFLLSEIEQLAINIRLACNIVDMPPCKMHCGYYVELCEKIAAELASHDVSITVIRGKQLDEMGLGGIYGVGKASDYDPALVVLSHFPPTIDATTPSVCMVGKGIVYDTGGLSIKVPPGMYGMKNDMAGSAAVLGAFQATVKSGGLQKPMHALLCIAENSVDSKAMRPDDVLFMLSGLTVEVNNTDAEGRLVLADGVHYAASRLNPELIIDIATLTGAQLITTGKKHAAVYCSHAFLETLAIDCGKYTGDLTFPMLYAPEFHRPEFKSAIADMKNSVADRMNSQASCAAQFIGNHIDDYLAAGKLWCHVDMAGPAMTGERASGFGVALLFDMIRKYCQ